MATQQNLLDRLLSVNVFKVGEFLLKSGVLSPIYIDLRTIIAYPKLLGDVAEAIYSIQKEQNIRVNVVCGVPYTALPIASVFSFVHDIPMIVKRKEAKDYGTKKIVEGVTQKGVSCLIIEDIVTSGTSVIETAEVLRKEGLVVTDCVVLLNRLQGGRENLAKAGITLHSLFNINDIFTRYCAVSTIETSLVENVRQYLEDNSYIPVKSLDDLSFIQRSESCNQPVAQRLYGIIASKKTNLCVAVDELHSEKLLELADDLGPHICMLKTHVDILSDFSDEVSSKLCALAHTHNFLIFEDRKFADIGNIVMHQYENGIYKIQQWADIVTVHGIPGSDVLKALKVAARGRERACVLIAEMSSKGALTDDSYSQKVVEMADSHSDFVIGFICQQKVSTKGSFLNMCPGVNIDTFCDSLGQQYKSPEEAVANGADILIVGRGICKSSNVVQTAVEYKNRGYNAYVKKYAHI